MQQCLQWTVSSSLHPKEAHWLCVLLEKISLHKGNWHRQGMTRVTHTVRVIPYRNVPWIDRKGDPWQKDTKDQNRSPELGTEMNVSRGSEERQCFKKILGHLLGQAILGSGPSYRRLRRSFSLVMSVTSCFLFSMRKGNHVASSANIITIGKCLRAPAWPGFESNTHHLLAASLFSMENEMPAQRFVLMNNYKSSGKSVYD